MLENRVFETCKMLCVFTHNVALAKFCVSHPRLLFRIADCDHKGRQRQPHIVILMHPWLQILIAGCDHKGRQKQPQITMLMHYRLQICIAGCDHTEVPKKGGVQDLEKNETCSKDCSTEMIVSGPGSKPPFLDHRKGGCPRFGDKLNL